MDLTFEKTELKKSYRIVVEKLDGGFISDATGRRKLLRDALDVTEGIALESVLDKLEDDVYHLNIDLIPKSEYEDYIDLLELHKKEEEEPMTIEKAKELGIVTVEKFDPNPIKNETVIEKEIAITEENAYRSGRLKAIDWKYFDEAIPMTNVERSSIAGCSANTLYNQWRKACKGDASFHLTKTRIIFTILAKYYEANLDIRTSTKDNMDKMKDSVLISLRELELMAAKAKFVYSTEVNKKIEEMRKHLL